MKKEKAMDDKKNLKRQRIKAYFLEAAKEIIINEGHEKVSARRVADMAGYSYATIYNYFKDINQMMREVKEAMVMELFGTLQKKMIRTAYDAEELKKGLRIYIEYYFENPNIFKFFYFYPFGRPSDEFEATYSRIDFGSMWSEAFKGLVQEGRIREQDIEITAKTLIYSIHGLITLCFSSNGDLTEEKVYAELDKIVDFILLKK